MAIRYEDALNDEQLAVVLEGDGPILVLAGAGSGKTRTLTYRVARLLEKGIPPHQILLATFTNKAAKAMLGRVEELVGVGAGQLWGGTFHHLGHRILRRHADRLGYDRSFTILDADDARQMVSLCASEMVGKDGRKLPKGDVLRDLISFSVNTGQTLEDLISDRNPHLLQYLDDILLVARRYVQKKRQQNAMDFDDLLVLWQRLLEDHADLRRSYGEQFRHILVDEYQDTNRLQGRITDLLGEVHQNLTVVGDDAQSIYSFRGANYANIMEFPDRYPHCRIYRLVTNYRSTPEILHMANLSIARNAGRFDKVLQAVRPGGPRPVVVAARNVNRQADFVAQRIIEHLREGIPPHEIAVLYRAHYHSMEVQMELTRRGVPFELRSGIRFFEQAHIKDVSAYLRLLDNGRDELAWKRVLNLQDKVGKVTAEKIWTLLQASESPLEAFLIPDTLRKIAKSSQPGLDRCRAALLSLSRQYPGGSPAELIETVLQHGYYDYLLESYTDGQSRAEDLAQLAAFSSRFDSLGAFLSEMALLTNMTEDDADNARANTGKVILSTIHQAKGLEWHSVFLVWCADGMIPLGRALAEPEGLEEERRLFYVATTRAKDHLYLSYPTVQFNRGTGYEPMRPSRFIRELSGTGLGEGMPYDAWTVDEGFDW